MKIFRLILVLLAFTLPGWSQTAAFKRSATNLPFATSFQSNHVFMIDRGGGSAPANVRFDVLAPAIVQKMGVVTPFKYGAAGDGTTDDTLSISNTFLELINGTAKVCDLGGKTYKISQQLPALSGNSIVVQNGALVTDSTSIQLLRFNQNNPQRTDNWTVRNVHLGRTGITTPPTSTSAGLVLATNTGTYNVNILVEHCVITNFNRNIVTYGAAQTVIQQNTLALFWSNNIYVGPGVSVTKHDMMRIVQNDMHNTDTGISSPDNRIITNGICIQMDGGTVSTIISENNIGYCKQAGRIFGLNGVGNVLLYNNEVEGMLTLQTNLTIWEFTNCYVRAWMNGGNSSQGNFGSSNYLGEYGIYSSGAYDHAQNYFGGNGAVGGLSLDIWTPNYSGTAQYPQVDAPFAARNHTTFSDGATLQSFPYGNVTRTTDTAHQFLGVAQFDGKVAFRRGGTDFLDITFGNNYGTTGLPGSSGQSVGGIASIRGNGIQQAFAAYQDYAPSSEYRIDWGGDIGTGRASPTVHNWFAGTYGSAGSAQMSLSSGALTIAPTTLHNGPLKFQTARSDSLDLTIGNNYNSTGTPGAGGNSQYSIASISGGGLQQAFLAYQDYSPGTFYTVQFGSDNNAGRAGPTELQFYVAPSYGSPGRYVASVDSGGLRNSVATRQFTADNSTLGLTTNSVFQLSSDNATAANRTFNLTAGSPGRTVTLIWSGTNQAELLDDSANVGAGNVRLNGNWTPTADDTLTLIGVGNDWFEKSRSAN